MCEPQCDRLRGGANSNHNECSDGSADRQAPGDVGGVVANDVSLLMRSKLARRD